MNDDKPRKGGAPGTTDQWPRWEGPQENRPRGYLPSKDDPEAELDSEGRERGPEDEAVKGDRS